VKARSAFRLSLLAAASVGLTAALAPPQAPGAPPPQVGGCDLFPAYSGPAGARSASSLVAWNQVVAHSPVDHNSRRYMRRIRRLGGNQSLHPDFGENPDYGIPYAVVPQTQQNVFVTVDAYPGESDFGPAPIPPNAPIEAGSDRHVLVVQQEDCDLYEMFNASKGPGDNWHADSTAFWSLDSASPRTLGDTSADAAGLPILPGLVRYGEVAAGEIGHAIRVAFDRTRDAYIRPATHRASDSCSRFLPPMGLRLRLKGRYYRHHRDHFPDGSQSRTIFEALHRYGMLVADNGGNFFLTGATSPNWDDDDLNRLKDVPGKAFLVVDSKASQTTPCG
jgi:hypothetical protein